MLSFHNDPLIKDKYLYRVIKHREMDNIIQGKGWENGKGCAVGCTLENYDHSRYPIELGLPEWLAKLEDRIFEGLEKEYAMTWPEIFLSSIPIGVDLSNMHHKLSILRLNNLLEIQNKLLEKYKKHDLCKIFKDTISSIKLIIECHELTLNKNYCDWSSARSESRSVVDSAMSAVWSEIKSELRSSRPVSRSALRSAMSAARSAAYSAESASMSAWSSARSAAEASMASMSAWSEAWKLESENLIKVIKNYG